MGIDVHCHLFPESYLQLVRTFTRAEDHRLAARIDLGDDGVERLAIQGIPEYAMTPDYWSPDALIAWMDEAGLEQVVLTPAPPTTSYWVPPRLGREVTRAINEGMAAATRAYPDRIIGGATVTLSDPARAPDELSEAVQRHGLRAAMILSNVNGKDLDEPEFFPFFARAAELGVPVFVHPTPFSPLGYQRLYRYYLFNVVGMTTDTTVAIASLIYGGVLERLPALRVWFPHAGGSFAILRGRIEHAYHVRPEAQGHIPRPPSAYLDRLAFDTLAHDPSVLRYVVETMTPRRVMIGSDYPFVIGTRRPGDIVQTLEHLTDEDREAILAGNARSFFGIGMITDH
ncbi:MAG: amidohydrolase [Chloroflexi bacterium]|nr:amidohydrolase [Chloroflexota bacterium]